jgi:hypothetical protein
MQAAYNVYVYGYVWVACIQAYTCVLAVYVLCAPQQFWGSNLDGVIAAPIDFGSAEMNDLIVYSTHLYGEYSFHYMCHMCLSYY